MAESELTRLIWCHPRDAPPRLPPPCPAPLLSRLPSAGEAAGAGQAEGRKGSRLGGLLWAQRSCGPGPSHLGASLSLRGRPGLAHTCADGPSSSSPGAPGNRQQPPVATRLPADRIVMVFVDPTCCEQKYSCLEIFLKYQIKLKCRQRNTLYSLIMKKKYLGKYRL